jgi:DNA-binding MarR family transcriptional regulator
MTAVVESTGRRAALDELRVAMGELFGAERRLRGREQQQPNDLTSSQMRALVILEREDEVTAGDLAKSADLNPASVTAMLDHLESKGIVERRRGDRDRRVCMVTLTDRGRELVDEKRARFQARWEEHLGELSEPELLGALRAMRTMIRLLDGI